MQKEGGRQLNMRKIQKYAQFSCEHDRSPGLSEHKASYSKAVASCERHDLHMSAAQYIIVPHNYNVAAVQSC